MWRYRFEICPRLNGSGALILLDGTASGTADKESIASELQHGMNEIDQDHSHATNEHVIVQIKSGLLMSQQW